MNTGEHYHLSIVVRHLAGREVQFARCIQSILDQDTASQVQVVILNDEVGRGVDWANAHLVEALKYVQGDHVLIIDDDDVLASDGVVARVLTEIRTRRLDLLVCQFLHSRQGILPPHADLARGVLNKGWVAGQCVIASLELFRQYVHLFGAMEYPEDYGGSGDFSYLTALMEASDRAGYCNFIVAERRT